MTLAPRPALVGVPVLETERLRLRGLQADDFDTFAAFAASARSAYVGGPNGRALAWRGFCHVTGHWVHRGYGVFAICDKATGEPLGTTGPWFPEGWPEPEIAWTIWAPDAEGKGYAFEAATAARAYAYGVLGWSTAISLIDPANARSAALARRMGCVPDGTFVHEQYGETNIWRHPSPDALSDGGIGACA